MQAAAAHCFFTPVCKSAAGHMPKTPSSTSQGRDAGPAPHRINRPLSSHLSTRGAYHTIVRT
eukprot:scaffold86530_cov23-Tisochrysis_lutea.AAC.1